jgi:hypothetical protein
MSTPRVLGAVAASMLAAGLLTGCSDDSEDWIEVTSPEPGSQVILPFEVTLNASVPLGPPAEEANHAHIWFGDDQDTYLVVESETVMISNAPAGEHEMHVTLHHADHTPVGPETVTRLVIGDGPPAEQTDKDDGGYDY